MSNKQAYVILSEIQRQLWSGHASVMIGSGFSRNADRASSTMSYPPDWNELARKFVDRLYPDSTDEDKNAILGKKEFSSLHRSLRPHSSGQHLIAMSRS